MCIILFAYKIHPKYYIVLAANRDEYYVRSTSRAAFWEDAPDILAGRDLERGGTWLGVTKTGRYAAVTNFHDPLSNKKGAPSRGFLVSDFLRSVESPQDYLLRTSQHSEDYNGFNLIVGDGTGLFYHTNKAEGVTPLMPGVYGLSNHLLDTPWPKVARGKQSLGEIVRDGDKIPSESVLDILADNTQADDALLPQTGIGLEYERALSPVFISTPVYGTRSSSVLLIDLNGEISFVERTFESGKPATDASFEFDGISSAMSSNL
jgi:uncharacterized protein with NRDE domain